MRMNKEEMDPLDRAIDETLASMVQGEPRRVSGPSLRKMAGEGRVLRLPAWLAVAAILVVAVGVALKERAPVAAPVGLAQSVPSPAPTDVLSSPSPLPTQAPRLIPAKGSRRLAVASATEAVYEGLPPLRVATMEPLEPLGLSPLDAIPVDIPRIEIAPLSVSSLSNEQEKN